MAVWLWKPARREQSAGKDIRTKVTTGSVVKNRQGGVIHAPIQVQRPRPTRNT